MTRDGDIIQAIQMVGMVTVGTSVLPAGIWIVMGRRREFVMDEEFQRTIVREGWSPEN